MQKKLQKGIVFSAFSLLLGVVLPHTAYAYSVTIGYAGTAAVMSEDGPDPRTYEENISLVLDGAVVAKTVDEVRNFNDLYFKYWHRDAMPSELQYHVDRVTPHDRLAAWLQAHPEGICFDNRTCGPDEGSMVGTNAIDRLEGQTVSTPLREFFLIKNGKRYKISDYPTTLSHGLLIDDRWALPNYGFITEYFEQKYPYGGMLNYTDGQYYNEIQTYWQSNGENMPSSLPENMQAVMNMEVGSNKTLGSLILSGVIWNGVPMQATGIPAGMQDTVSGFVNLLDWSYLE